MLRFKLSPLVVFVALSACAFGQNWGSPIWQDEFDGVLNSPIDPAKWTYDTGNLGVNQELEFYCNPTSDTPPCSSATPNAYVDGTGHLVIQHRAIAMGNNITWTSARLKTQGMKTFQYGRLESRLQIPSHQGLWPAFWMLGANIATVNWPRCGEVDIMENWPGIGAAKNATSLHGDAYSGGNSLTSQFAFPNGERVDTAFHTYGIIWSPNMMQFYIDDPSNITFVRTAADVPAGGTWPFNNPFFLITNMAVGGILGGTPDAGTAGATPSMMLDYVRYYQAATVAGPTMTPANAITLNAGASGTATVNLNSTSGSGLVYLACTGAPAKSTCTIDTGNSRNAHVVDFTSTSTGQAIVHVTTTGNTGKAVPFKTRSQWLALTVPILFGVLLLPLRKRAAIRSKGLIAGLFFALIVLPSCGGSASGGGGGGTTGTPTGHYSLTVTAYTVSGDTSTATVSLDVN